MKVKYVAYSFTAILLVIGCFQLGSGIKIASKAWLSEYLIEQAWSRTLAGESNVQPWPWADTWPVAELNIPKLDVSQVVLSGDSGRVLAFGPGMSRYIDAGLAREMTFVSGHRDTHFYFLKDIQNEDTFSLKTAEGKTQYYRVVETRVVDEHWQIPEQVAKGPRVLILATCYLMDENNIQADKRLLVFARLIEENEAIGNA